MAYEDDINSVYQQHYGRDASQDELDAHRGNPGGAAAVGEALKASQQGATPPAPAPDANTGPKAPAIWAGPQAPTPPKPAPPSGGSDPDGRATGTDDRAWFGNLIGGLGNNLTPESLASLGPQLAQRGFTLMPSANGKTQKIRSPQGQMIDVIQGADTGMNKSQWLQADQQGGAGAIRPGAGAGWASGGGSYSAMAAGGGGAAGGAGAPSGVSGDLYDMLLKRAHQGTQIDRNDPNVRAQVDPYTAQVERTRRDYVADAAEKGGPLANIQGEKRLSAERAGQASGQFESQIIGRELSAKRDEIQSALTQLGSQLSEDQRQALQKELAYLNDATQRYGIDAQSKTAKDQLGLGYGQLGLGYGQLGLGKDRLGLDYSNLDWDMDPRNPRNLGS